MGLCSGESCHRIQVTRGSSVLICTYTLYARCLYMSMQVVTLYIAVRIAIEYVDGVLYIENNRDIRLYTS